MTDSATLTLLLEMIDQAYDHRAWHGTNLRGSLRRVTPMQAGWRPGPGRHNIREITIHAAYWKYSVKRRLLGEKRGSFPLKGSNWFERPVAADPGGWREEIALLDAMHRAMRDAVAGISPAALNRRIAGSVFLNRAWLYGIASHDLYHAGQIQLIKRLMPGRL